MIFDGRAGMLRAALYMATVAASRCNLVIEAFHQRLRDAGKFVKIALTAYMRKLLTILNPMLKAKTPWQPPTECRSRSFNTVARSGLGASDKLDILGLS